MGGTPLHELQMQRQQLQQQLTQMETLHGLELWTQMETLHGLLGGVDAFDLARRRPRLRSGGRHIRFGMDGMEEALRRSWEEGAAMRPAAASAIQALPTRTVAADESNAEASGEHKSCVVCMEGFKGGDEQRTLPCFHSFHRGCIDEWLKRSGTCPVCKLRIDGVPRVED